MPIHIPKVTIELDGVIAMRVQAMLDVRAMSLDPQSESSWEQVTNRKLITNDPVLLGHCLQVPGFYQAMDVYPDFNAAELEEEMDGGTVKVICVCHRPNLRLAGSQLPEQMDADYQTLMWLLHKAGMRSVLGARTDVIHKVEKLVELKTELHVDSDMPDFLMCQDAGIPVLLWDRPWNRALETDKRIRSVSEILAHLGVTRDRTALAYAEPVY